jgi:hypothetical protein
MSFVRKESRQSVAKQTGTNRRKINGKFWVSVFASEPLRSAENVKASRSYLDSADGLTKRVFDASGFLTSIAGTGLQPD